MQRASLRHRLAISVTIALVLAACSSGETATDVTLEDSASSSNPTALPPSSDPVAPDDGPLAGATLAVSSAEQLDRVGLLGLDTSTVDTTRLMAIYEIADGDWWGSRIMVDSGGPYLLAPLFVPDPTTGGDVTLYLADDNNASAPLQLTVTPMTAAPGSFDDALAALEANIDALAAEFDSSWESLAAMSPGDTPPELAPLKLAQLLLDGGPGYGAAASYAALDPADAELLDAVFAKIDIPAGLDTATFDSIASYLPEQIAAPGEAAEPTVGGESEPAGLASPQGFAGAVRPQQGASCIPFYQEADGKLSPERLSQMMIGSAFSDIAVNPDGAPGKTFAALEATLSLGSALEAGASSGKSKAFDTFGKMAGGWKLFNAMRAGLFPSSFTHIDVTLDPGDLEEDRPFSMPGEWNRVSVIAASTGYSLDGDIAGELAGAFGGELMSTRLTKQASVPEDSLDWFHRLDDAVDVTDINDAAGAEPIKQAVNELLPADGVITFCPQTFTADLAEGEGEWTWARPRAALFTVDNAAGTYVNKQEVGSDTLSIGPIPAKFGQHSIYAEVPVETKPIRVSLGATTIYVTRPGDPVDITATISDAYDTRLQWISDKGTWAASGTAVHETDDGSTQTLVTPTATNDFPFEVAVESLSESGLRAERFPRRADLVQIKLSPFTIDPDPGSVTVEEMLGFTAKDADDQPIAVEWSATGGTITRGPSPTAVYTAGKRTGSYTVTARLPGDPESEVTVTVNIGDRACILGNWELDLPAFVGAMNQAAEDGSVAYISGDSQLIIRDDDTTTWLMNDVRLRVSSDGETFTMIWNSQSDNPYTANGGVITSAEGGTATFNMFVVEFDQGIDMTVPTAIGGSSAYECTPRERLLIHTDDGDLLLTYNGPT